MTFARDLPPSFREALKVAARILGANHELVRKGVVDAEAEQIVIAAYRMTTGLPLTRLELFSRLADRLAEPAGEKVLVLAGARAEGKLLQHLLGYQAFLGHEYEVSAQVLVPRPETEVLVDAALKRLGDPIAARSPRLGLEIGIGSGVISIELLARFRGLRMIASELRAEAERVAQRNAERILGAAGAGGEGAGRLAIVRATRARDVWEPFAAIGYPPSQADFVISNPPYLAAENEADPEVVAQEPHSALFAPADDPLLFYREVATGAAARLAPGGLVFLELAAERSEAIVALFSPDTWQSTEVLLDLNGRPRVLIAQGKGEP